MATPENRPSAAAVRLVGFLKDGLSRDTVHGLQLPQWEKSDLEATQKNFDDLQVILRCKEWLQGGAP